MENSGPNRVLVGLPDRLAKAREQIGVYEHREGLIKKVLNEPLASDLTKLATISGICAGKYDDAEL